MSDGISDGDVDFTGDDFNQFYYTNERFIRRMDDGYIISKISEKYPDISTDSDENILKQSILVMMNDSRFVCRLEKDLDMNATEIFKVLYRNFEFVFSKCFVTKVQKTIKNKKYARKAVRMRGKPKKKARS